jgi:hypothetical protein
MVYIDVHVAAYFIFNIVDSFQLKFDGLCNVFVRVDYVYADYIRVDSAAPWSMSTAARRSGARCRTVSTARGLHITSPLCAEAHAEDL